MSVCADCQGTGRLLAEGRSVLCGCMLPPAAEYLELCGVPARYCHFDPQQVQGGWKKLADETLEAGELCRWDGQRYRVVTLWGATGPGKSTISARLMWQAMKATPRNRTPRPVWAHAFDLTADYGRGDLVQRAHAAAVVVVDGVGEVQAGSWAYEIAGRVIRHAWETRRPVVVNTNHSPAELLERCNPLADVLRDGPIVEVIGDSQRGPA